MTSVCGGARAGLEYFERTRDDKRMPADPPTNRNADLKPPITLTTDFGAADTYVAQMKGVIAGIVPGVRVIDGTHGIPAQDILAGAIALDSIVDAFPDGAIHVVVVDPGVGSERAAVAVKTERFVLVGPDNGLFTLVLDRYPPTAIVNLNNPTWHRVPVSPTFHGRDIFAPVAAHLASGTPINQLGEPATTLVNLNIPGVEMTPRGLTAVTLTADRFGNLVTNLTRKYFDGWLSEVGAEGVVVSAKRYTIGPIRQTFTDVEPGELVAYFGSSGRLELAMRNGSAYELLGKTRKLRVELKPV